MNEEETETIVLAMKKFEKGVYQIYKTSIG
jgi:hypothetical protein